MTNVLNKAWPTVQRAAKQLQDTVAVVWAAFSVGVTILAGLGFMALQPIKDNNARLETALVRLTESAVLQKDMKWRTARSAEDRARTEVAVQSLGNDQVPRKELERVWAAEDQQHRQIEKQIDEIKQGQTSTYGARDILLDLKEN